VSYQPATRVPREYRASADVSTSAINKRLTPDVNFKVDHHQISLTSRGSYTIDEDAQQHVIME